MDWHFQGTNDDREHTKRIIIEYLNRIKAGDDSAREEFILRFRPFILKLVYKATDRHVEPENSEEYSVALLAFNEAINAYDEEKHSNFLVFSEQVINRRLIDYKRKNHKNKMVYPFSYFENEDIKLERTLSDADGNNAIERLEFTDEIRLFKSELASFDITFKDLLSCTPKHRDSRELLINIAKKIASNDGLYEKLKKTKKLPTLELLKLAKVSRRTIERNKKYIIAVSLILRSNLEIFKEYAAGIQEKEVDLR
ncbi:MAG TPA: RNA polymerase sigma-I factor [Hungateiclostridium thermocellum]|uniref:RNA polymerase sigma factor SigI6 n=3 Tax=Acetivibrio thermocellus TaxID=1515 RepID=SIGI6_ACET2|nr:RNA polymerase sigma-I factor [Acetivibrio thermocellus]A3DH98.1 RecName: Full=RNA polymerase sigma factor SigI6 [Acetivibrio thermocellus ATCC 27405]CDG36622.1 putative RNA polymerase sigma factor SigI [Acetivibrio thermocellus BC1]ABN53327.1 RNA polymerase sigma-I factor [Acetivibrio thermocellus ATCC 27405]ADU75762.1 RNA polymerase sigma-I factor [Acetivibrio thermocellus DSM 1313]ALX09792.1 RNA polymerase, alternative sigma subunit, sigma-I6, SigI6 [Acetivibrio thermocellus AD2]ANV7756